MRHHQTIKIALSLLAGEIREHVLCSLTSRGMLILRALMSRSTMWGPRDESGPSPPETRTGPETFLAPPPIRRAHETYIWCDAGTEYNYDVVLYCRISGICVCTNREANEAQVPFAPSPAVLFLRTVIKHALVAHTGRLLRPALHTKPRVGPARLSMYEGHGAGAAVGAVASVLFITYATVIDH